MYLFPLAAALPLPQVTTLHGQFPFDRMTAEWQGDADHYYMEWLSRIPLVAISEHARRSEQEKFPLNFIDVVYHGVDLKNFAPPCTVPEDFFLWLGRLTPEKGAHLAIEAARKAGVPLILAGIIDQNIPEVQRYFQEQIKPEIDGRQITYIGPVSPQERNDLLHRARGMLNPILWEEPFGMVMIEAMAAGCPVIAFRRGAAGEIITSEKVGFLVNDVAEMVEGIQNIDTIDRNTVRRSIETHFSAQIMAENYTGVYKQVIRMEMNKKQLTPLSPTQNSAPTVPGREYAELKQQLKSKGLLDKQPAYYTRRIALLFGLLVVGIVVLLRVHVFWLQLLNAAYLAFVFTQIGLLSHEAGHRQMFHRAWKHDLLGLVGGNFLLGMSYSWWVDKHNRHHSHPNQVGMDPDIDIPFLTLTGIEDLEQPGKLKRFCMKYQAFLFFPGLMAVAVGLQYSSIAFLLRKKAKYQALEWFLIVAHFGVSLALVFLCLGLWQAILFVAVHQALTGLYLGSIFAPNHKGMPILGKESNLDFFHRQI